MSVMLVATRALRVDESDDKFYIGASSAVSTTLPNAAAASTSVRHLLRAIVTRPIQVLLFHTYSESGM